MTVAGDILILGPSVITGGSCRLFWFGGHAVSDLQLGAVDKANDIAKPGAISVKPA